MEKLSPNCSQLFVRNKYTVFTMGGTVALRSVSKKISESYSSAASLLRAKGFVTLYMGHHLMSNQTDIK